MLLIAGLGNPGPSYVNTRHNTGFQVVEAIARNFNADFSTKHNLAVQLAKIPVEQHTLLLAKPQTYMNNSGLALLKLYSHYKSAIQKLVVIYDELDLPIGTAKIKIGGGSAGHKGVQSIDQHLGKNYIRIRIGVGRPSNNADVSRYVLENFNSAEQSHIEHITSRLVDNLTKLIDICTNEKLDQFPSIL